VEVGLASSLVEPRRPPAHRVISFLLLNSNHMTDWLARRRAGQQSGNRRKLPSSTAQHSTAQHSTGFNVVLRRSRTHLHLRYGTPNYSSTQLAAVRPHRPPASVQIAADAPDRCATSACTHLSFNACRFF
jgi:hypothetical protein